MSTQYVTLISTEQLLLVAMLIIAAIGLAAICMVEDEEE